MHIIKDSIKTIITSLITLSLISVAYAWTEPTTTPPSSNVNPPITTSSDLQTKTGWFTADNIETYGKTTLATVTGNVGIGIASTEDPASKLEIKSTLDEILRLTRDGGTFPTIFKQGTDDTLVINSGNKDALTIKSGSVGIGTTEPGANLEIRSNSLTSDILKIRYINEVFGKLKFGSTGSGNILAGPNNPAFAGNNTTLGTKLWSGTSNIYTSDNVWAMVSSGFTNPYSNYLVANTFNFSIPDNAMIKGIKVEIKRYANGDILDNEIKLVKGGVVQGQNKAISNKWLLSYGESYATYGGDSDLWGNEWTPGDINREDFGVAVAAYFGTSISINKAYIDHIKISVTYETLSNGRTLAITAGNGNDSHLSIRSDGNVGIGTTEPAIKLAIGDTDTGLHWISDGNLAVYANNKEIMTITTTSGFSGTDGLVTIPDKLKVGTSDSTVLKINQKTIYRCYKDLYPGNRYWLCANNTYLAGNFDHTSDPSGWCSSAYLTAYCKSGTSF